MILTNCAACAAPLPRPAKQCSRCKTLYCGPACQRQHWERGGHDALCKKIKKGGGAEQYHADKKYKEALAVAVEKCAADTKGQKCYICLEAVHSSTGEGLVRGCACEGNQGFAHLSCLVHVSSLGLQETKDRAFASSDYLRDCERNATTVSKDSDVSKDIRKIGQKMLSCRLCKKQHDAIILHAIGWGYWKNCASKSEQRFPAKSDECAQVLGALANLAMCLGISGHVAEATEVEQTIRSTIERLGGRWMAPK